MEPSLAVSWKVNTRLQRAQQPRSWVSAQRKDSVCSHEGLHTNVHHSFIRNSVRNNATVTSPWTGKHAVVYPYDAYRSAVKGNPLLTRAATGMPGMTTHESSQTETECTPHDATHRQFQDMQTKAQGQKADEWLRGTWRGRDGERRGWIPKGTGHFWGQWECSPCWLWLAQLCGDRPPPNPESTAARPPWGVIWQHLVKWKLCTNL